jgi:SAM-dependent methyltransferase
VTHRTDLSLTSIPSGPWSVSDSRATALRRALAAAPLDDGAPDDELDEVYPPAIRAVSSSFWTPVRVALRAAELLVTSPATRVLDVGSGVGKFCLVGAAATGATFVGVEHRARFVAMATRVAAECGVPSAHFRCATFETVDVEEFDAIYFFNPFEENLWRPADRLDETVPLSRERFALDTTRAKQLLARARVGTRVVTYHGFGSNMPPGFRLDVRERQGSGCLDRWTKTEQLPWSPEPPPRHVLSWLPGAKERAEQAASRLRRG